MYKTLPPIFPIFRSIHKHVDFWSTICWHYVPDELHVFIQTLEGTNGQAPTGKTCRNKCWNRQFFLHIQFSGSHHQKFPEWREFSMRMMGNFGCEGKHARRPIRWLYTWIYDFEFESRSLHWWPFWCLQLNWGGPGIKVSGTLFEEDSCREWVL